MEPHITWLGHASFRIEGEGMVIYVDPWKLKSAKEADLILVTHSHHDHLSEDDISKVRSRRTEIIGSTDVASKLAGAIPMRPGDEREVMGVKVEAHRAAVIRFRGYLKARLLDRKTEELKEWLAGNNLTPAGAFVSAQYNPPWIPGFLRRNEILVRV